MRYCHCAENAARCLPFTVYNNNHATSLFVKLTGGVMFAWAFNKP
jgi:hypothetical protein